MMDDDDDAYGKFIRKKMDDLAGGRGGEKPEHHDSLVRKHLFSSGDIVIRPGNEKRED